MKVVRSLAYYLQSRGLLSQDEIAELRRKGFLETIEPGDRERPDDWDGPSWGSSKDDTEIQIGDEPAAAVKPRTRGKPRRPGSGLPELEASLRPILPVLEADLERLKPLAVRLGLRSDPSDWPRLFEEAGERLTEALRDVLAGGKVKFEHLWRAIAEDPWQQVRPPERVASDVWSAWRVLLSSRDGPIPASYRWILRSDAVGEIYRRIQLQRTMVRALGAVFADSPEVLWRAATRPFHEAGFLALSFAYTAAVDRARGVPIRVACKTDRSETRCFAVSAGGAVAVPAVGGGVRIFAADGTTAVIGGGTPGRIEALAFHPAGDRLYISRTDETGVNRVLEVEPVTGAQRTLLEAYASPQGPVCVEREKSLLYYRPAGAEGFRLFRPDVADSGGFLASPFPIDPSNDFGFLPGGRYFGAVVRRTPIARQYRIWDWSDGKLAGSLELGPAPPKQRAVLASSRQRKVLAYCGATVFEIYDAETLNIVVRHEHNRFVAAGHGFSATFCNDGRWLLKWSASGEIMAWDWSSGAEPFLLEQHGYGTLQSVAIDGNFAAGFRQSQTSRAGKRPALTQDFIVIWDLETGRLHRTEFGQQFLQDRSCLWTTEGKLGLLRYTERDPACRPKKSVTGRRLPVGRPFNGISLEVWWPLPDGERRAFQLPQEEAPGDLIDIWLFPDRDVVLLRFRLADGQVEMLEFSLTKEIVTSRKTVSLPRFHPVVGCYEDLDLGTGRQLDFYDAISGERRDRWSIPPRTRTATSMKVVDNGAALAVCFDGQSLVLVDLAAGTQAAETLLTPADGPHRLLAVESDGASGVLALLASGRALKTVSLNASGSELRPERRFEAATCWSAGPSVATPRAAYGARGQLELSDRPYSEERPIFLHPEDGAGDWIPAFSPDGGFLSAVRKEEFRMWSADGRALCRRLFLSEEPFGLQYSLDGETVWVADRNGTFWKIAVDRLQPPPDARFPAWDLPGREILMQAWTVARKLASIETGDWLPLLAAACMARDAGARLGYSDLGLLAPAIWAA